MLLHQTRGAVLAIVVVIGCCYGQVVSAESDDYLEWSDTKCEAAGDSSSSLSTDSRNSLQQVGAINLVPTAELSPQAWMKSSVSETLIRAYACLDEGDIVNLGTYFTDEALESLQSQMSLSELLNRFGPRVAFKVVTVELTSDGRTVAEISFDGPIGRFSEHWVLKCSSSGCLIDAIIIPSEGNHSNCPIIANAVYTQLEI